MENKSYICGVLIVLLMIIPVRMRSQSSGQNYVAKETMLDEDGTRSIKKVQYYDGLGRPSVLASGGVNTCGKYVYSMSECDMFGRESKRWLPTVGGESPDVISEDDFTRLSNRAYNDSRAFSVTSYDVLGRPSASSTPGDLWKGKSKSVEYITNKKDDVKKYLLSSSGIPERRPGYYKPCSLIGERRIDEDGHILEVYKDFSGNVILERRNDGTANNDTYFVYDDGLLSVVIPPLYQKTSSNSLLYRYKYDGHGRCVEKILPGCQPIKYWYDKCGHLAFMQDARMRAAKKYRFFLYDCIGRMVVQGLTKEVINNSDEEYVAEVERILYKEFPENPLPSNIEGTDYFMISSHLISSPYIEIVNYYDDYYCLTNRKFGELAKEWGKDGFWKIRAMSLLTAQIVTDNNDNRYYRLMYYDQKGRCIEAISTSIDDYFVKTNTSYSFTDKPIKNVTKLYKSSSNNLLHTMVDSIEYNSVCDLLEKEYLQLDGNPMECVADNVYDDLGRLVESKSHDGVIRDMYSYNIHGWQTNHQHINTDVSYSPIFNESLYYADGPNELKCYNGNISAQAYTDARMNVDGLDNTKGYLFTYDGMDRLTKAKYMTGKNLSNMPLVDYSEEVTYNANSSFMSLKRSGCSLQGPAYIDNVTFSYAGNRLIKAKDKGVPAPMMGDAFHFVGDNIDHTSVDNRDGYEYRYDGCGSLVSDLNKGIRKITYDFNGMPTCVWFEDGSIIDYVYTSDGSKLKTTHRTAVPGLKVSGDSSELTDENTHYKGSILYVGAYEINGGKKYKYNFANGYLDINDNKLSSYVYYTKDHLGNVRHVASFAPKGRGTVSQVNNYYPFGGLLNEGENRLMYNKMYSGKEYDSMHGLNLYDFSARQYDAAIGQFTSVDPLCENYYHISPYSYCAGNPVKYVDPDGGYIQVKGDADFLDWTLTTLQMLTNDILVMDKKGFISIAKGKANPGHDLSIGTRLLREVIGNKHTATVERGENSEKPVLVGKHWDKKLCTDVYDNEFDPYNGKGTHVKIHLKKGEDVKSVYFVSSGKDNTGNSKRAGKRPEYVGAAHELIHGLRDMKGEAVRNIPTRYEHDEQAGLEELHTVGILGNYRYSENKIRKEHGLKWRRTY